MEKVRIGNCKSLVNEDLFFPAVKYVDVKIPLFNLPIASCETSLLTSSPPFRTFLKTELKSTKDCVNYKCPTKNCQSKSTFHPDFIHLGVAGCYSCDGVDNIIKKITKAKGYRLIRIYLNDRNEKYTEIECQNSHNSNMSYKYLRQGKECTECSRQERRDKKGRKPFEKIPPKTCNCKFSRSSPRVCEHYNFGILYPDAAMDWCYLLNDVLPNEVSPSSGDEYWYNCGKCRGFYQQQVCSKKNNAGCPYCSNRKVSKTNNLLVTDPEIAAEWDIDKNFKYPNEVTRGCGDKVQWICRDTEIEHYYKQKISRRTGVVKNGCYCKNKTHKQKTGKHAYFVEISSKIHNNKYSYPEEYIDGTTKINIYCPVLYKNNVPHGNFLQSPSDHKRGTGCTVCGSTGKNSRGMLNIKNLLHSFGYVENADFWCEQKLDGMTYIKALRLDFYLKIGDVRIGIEFDGVQHFSPVEIWGGAEGLEKTQKKDYAKDLYCLKNKISLLRFPYNCDVTSDYLKEAIECCLRNHVYMSYTRVIKSICKEIDLSKIVVLENKSFE